jgi:hypothetical protein
MRRACLLLGLTGCGSSGLASHPSNTVTGGACLPSDGAVELARVGADLVACTSEEQARCWTIDRTSGALAPRSRTAAFGFAHVVPRETLTKPGCYQDLCWTPPATEEPSQQPIYVARHADGKRVVIADEPTITVFDLASKRATATFREQLGNTLTDVWFVGELVVVQGSDAGPHADLAIYSPGGKDLATVDEIYNGSVGITGDGRVVISEDDLSRVYTLDPRTGKPAGETHSRAVAKAPDGCDPFEPGMDPESTEPAVKACIAYRHKTFDGFMGPVTDLGDGFAGLVGSSLFVVDKQLRETSRVTVPSCPPAAAPP